MQPCTYLSERGMPLLYVGALVEKAVITLENYTKWYRVYMVLPDGQVHAVSTTAIEEANEKIPFQGWADHLFHPQLLIQLARDFDAEIDERALECAAGRWMRENPSMVKIIEQHPVLEFGGDHELY